MGKRQVVVRGVTAHEIAHYDLTGEWPMKLTREDTMDDLVKGLRIAAEETGHLYFTQAADRIERLERANERLRDELSELKRKAPPSG